MIALVLLALIAVAAGGLVREQRKLGNEMRASGWERTPDGKGWYKP